MSEKKEQPEIEVSEERLKKLVPGWPLPEVESINDEQEEKIKKLIDIVLKNPAEGSPTPPKEMLEANDEDQRILGYKFLIARKWKMEDAEKMWKDTIKYKTDMNCFRTDYFPAAFPVRGWNFDELNTTLGYTSRKPDEDVDRTYTQFAPAYAATYHKWDKLGHPVFIERTGLIKVKPVVACAKACAKIGEPLHGPIIRYHVHFNEVGARLVRYQDQVMGPKVGRRVLGVTAVLDCRGLGYGHLHNPALDILKQVWACDSSYYPEGLHKLFIVNTPGMINFAYNIVKGWLDPRIQQKLLFVKPDKTAETLLQVIDAENLPEFLGGKCNCEGGCVETLDEAIPMEGGDNTMAEEVKVGAGKNETREFPMEPGEQVTWEFEVSQMNVEFSVTYIPDAEGSEPIEVVKKEKAKLGTSDYEPTVPGRLVLIWDNHYSWMNSKSVRLRVMKRTM